jgi:tetratricopeptide (TPR) repeat protein
MTIRLRFAFLLLLTGLLAGCGADPGRQALLEGVRALESGQNERAATLLEDAGRLARTPANRAAALNFLGVARYRQGHLDQAAAAFRDSARAGEHLAAPRYNLAALADDQGREDEALALLGQASDAEPRNAAALEYAAAIHLRRQRWDQARALLEQARAREPRSPSTLTALALLDLQDGRLEDARIRLQKVAERAPSYPPAAFNLALVCSRLPGREHEAERLWEKVLALAPPEPQAALARAALARNRDRPPAPSGSPAASPESQPAYVLLLDNARTLAAANRLAAAVNLYLRAAVEAEQAGRPDIARDAAARAQTLCPPEPEPRLALAAYWLDHGRPDLAKSPAREALSARPDWPEALVVMARLALAEQNDDAALEALARALAQTPPHADALWLRAALFEDRLGNPARAGQDLRLFLQAHPADPRADAARTRLSRIETGARRP